jgi:TolA-binding protein
MMMRFFGLACLLLGAGLCHRPAEASFDYWCEPSWQLVHRDRTECDNMAVLAPGNDTRANLLMLMVDLRGKPMTPPAAGGTPDPFAEWPAFGRRFTTAPADSEGEGQYAYGEGSRCRSNESGTAAFVAQVNDTAAVPDAERATLIAARQGLRPDCAAASGGETMAESVQAVQSPIGKSFAAYLQGAQAFYDADYETARMEFSSLIAVDQPWLAETARYMLGRVEVNRAQIGAFDEYGYPKETAVDAKIIDGADLALRDYLAAYPQGTYAASARGLLRRVYWLGKRVDALAGSYKEMLVADPTERGGLSDVDLLDEIDNKLLTASGFEAPSEPILLAVEDLAGMRRGEGSTPIARSEIEAQRPAFAANPALFDYLLAAYDFYLADKPEAVLAAIPAATAQAPLGYLEFSRQVLRGMALEARNEPSVRDHWLALLAAAEQPLQRPAVELALAMHDERAGALDKIFAADSKITNPSLRVILLRTAADANLLRRQATNSALPQQERDDALYALLYKEVTRGHYAEFGKDLALVRADAPVEGYPGALSATEPPPLGVFTQTETLGDYGCGPLKETATQLAKNPKSPKAQLCLADFIRANGFDQNQLDLQAEEGQLGSRPSRFEGKPYARLEVYKSLIAGAKTPPEDKAYALYRAVRCYAPAQINSCGGEDVPQAQRKAWFQQLKKRYPNSRWAKELQNYW